MCLGKEVFDFNVYKEFLYALIHAIFDVIKLIIEL